MFYLAVAVAGVLLVVVTVLRPGSMSSRATTQQAAQQTGQPAESPSALSAGAMLAWFGGIGAAVTEYTSVTGVTLALSIAGGSVLLGGLTADTLHRYSRPGRSPEGDAAVMSVGARDVDADPAKL